MSTLSRHASLLIALVVLGGAFAPAAPAPPGKSLPAALGINVPLAKEQLKVIDQIVVDMDRLYRGGELSATDPGFILWSRPRGALRESGASKAELIAALEQLLVKTKNREAWVKTQHQTDATTSRTDVLAARYERLEAEMWLNREKAR